MFFPKHVYKNDLNVLIELWPDPGFSLSPVCETGTKIYRPMRYYMVIFVTIITSDFVCFLLTEIRVHTENGGLNLFLTCFAWEKD